ncbi:hypothetical protein PIROE2DRAFT_11201, partial [Piromyces sp. E2]
MKRSLKELKERQKKNRQNNLEKFNNRLTSYGFSSSKSSLKKVENNGLNKSISNDISNSSLKPSLPLKRSQSLNVIPNKKLKAEDENNSIVKDPFSLLKHISNIEENDNDNDNDNGNSNENDKKKENFQNSLNNLSSNIFNIDYLNSEMKQFTEPSTNNIDDSDIYKKVEILKVPYDNLIDKEELHYYNTRHFIESDDDISISDKESVASDTDIKDIEIPYENYNDVNNEMKTEQKSNPLTNNSVSQDITNKNNSNSQSRLLLDTLQQNDEINKDISSAQENNILNDIEKKNIKNIEKEKSKMILEGNGFRDQLKLK